MKASNKQQFDEALAAVLKVSHTELKDMLEAEKAKKKEKRQSKTSALGRVRRDGKG